LTQHRILESGWTVATVPAGVDNKKAPEGAFLFLPIPEKNKQTISD
jgi:hypothetical protein